MKTKKRYVFIVIVIIFISSALCLVIIKKNKVAPVNSIKLSDLQDNSDFYLTGVVEPKNIVDYKLDKNKGVISEKKVSTGDEVKKGQVLYIYKNPDGDMQVQEAELAVRNSEKMVEQKEIESNLKSQQYNNLVSRQQKIDKQLADAKSDQEKQELTEQKEELFSSITQAEIDMSSANTEIENAKLEVEKSNLELNKIKETQGEHEVLSDIDGIVMNLDDTQLNLTVTDKIPETPFLSIVDTSEYFLTGKVDEYRKNTITNNQNIKIIDRNDSTKSWVGHITQVGNLAAGGVVDEEQGGNSNLSQFSFKASIDSRDNMPEIGLHCFAELDTTDKDDELTIPKDYVIKHNKETYIWVVKNKRVEKKIIKVEEYKDDNARFIVKDNLDRDIEVIYPSTKIKEGMEITPNDSIN